MDQTPDNPKPARHSRWRMLITPWRWNRWTWAAIVPLLLAAYFFSALPAVRLAGRSGPPSFLWDATQRVYSPVLWSAQNSEIVAAVIQWQNHRLLPVLGDEVFFTSFYPTSYIEGPVHVEYAGEGDVILIQVAPDLMTP